MLTGRISLSKNPLLRSLPAGLMMAAIFLFSAGDAVETSQPLLSMIVNKAGHMIGYGLLALAFWRIFEFKMAWLWLAWLLATFYGLTDEFHQSFVPGRHPSLVDALFFDALGSLVALTLFAYFLRQGQPARKELVTKD